MDIELDPQSTVPLSQQIRDRIVEGIATGRLRAGDALASVRGLSAAFGINPATVVKAYDLLRGERLIVSTKRSGTVVSADPSRGGRTAAELEEWRARLFTVLAEGHAHGRSVAELQRDCERLTRQFVGASEGV